MATKRPPPIEISNALAALDILRVENPGYDHNALAKTLPPLAQMLARNDQDVSIEALRSHAEQGVDHLRDLYEALNTRQKNKAQKTYAEIVASLPPPPLNAEEQVRQKLDLLMAKGDIDTLRIAIEDGTYDKDAALQLAASGGHLKCAKFLIKCGADIHANHEHAILLAAINGRANIVRLLIKHGADIHTNGEHPLRLSAANGHANVVRLLIKHGADIYAYNVDNEYALPLAVKEGRTNIVRLLIKNGADIHHRTDAGIQWAALNGHINIMRLLIKHGADIHAFDDAPLRSAAMSGHADIMRLLIRHGADVHARNEEALLESVKNGHLEAVRLLIKHGADIHASGEYALRQSARIGHVGIVRLLIENGADIHANGVYIKDNAVKNSHCNILKLLSEYGMDQNTLPDSVQEKIAQFDLWSRLHNMETVHPTLLGKNPHLVKSSTLTALSEIFVAEGYVQEFTTDIFRALCESSADVRWKYSYNIAALLGTESRVLQYLEKWGTQGKQPLHDITQMIAIPTPQNIKKYQKPDLKAWGDAVLQCGPGMAALVKFSHRLPRPMQDASGRFWSLQKTKDEVAQFAFDNARKNHALAALGMECGWDNDDFNEALIVLEKYQATYAANDNRKPVDAIPNITIDGAEFDKEGFTFRRLPDGDLRGLALGAFTACCQHMGGAGGSECAAHGFLSPKSAFYIVSNNKTNQVVAQSWAWRGKKGELVLDSLEYLPSQMNDKQWTTLCQLFAAEATKTGIEKIHVGKGGNTPMNMGFPAAKKSATPADYDGYRDSGKQYVIAGPA